MKNVGLASLGILLVALVILATSSRYDPPPSLFEGRPVRDWALDLNSPSAPVREQAVQTIRKFDADAVPALVSLLRTRDPVLAKPIQTIGARSPKSMRMALYDLIDPFEAPFKRAAGAQALRLMGTNALPALPTLVRAVRTDPTVAWSAALTVAELGEPGRTALLAALPDLPPAQRGFVCYALGTQGRAASNAVPALIGVLQAGPAELSDKAASALAAIGPSAVRPLSETLSHPDFKIRLLAIRTLTEMGTVAREALPGLIGAARDSHPDARAAVLAALGRIGPRNPGVVSAITNGLVDSSQGVRLAALRSLIASSAPPGSARPILLTLLVDESAEVRAQSAALLGQMGSADPATLGALRGCLHDPDARVQTNAVEALRRWGAFP